MTYQCHHCGEVHDDLPHLGFNLPDLIHQLSEEERAQRAHITDDLCVLDDEHFFIRGVIEIPVHGEDEPFGFGVWVSQSREHFLHYKEHFHEHDFGPWFGWLSNELAYFQESTMNLKTMAHFRADGLRPYIDVELTDHPLTIAQHEGITLEQAWEIVHHTLGD